MSTKSNIIYLVFYAVFVVVFVGFMLVFSLKSIFFGLTFEDQTAILVLEDFILYSKFELYKKLIP